MACQDQAVTSAPWNAQPRQQVVLGVLLAAPRRAVVTYVSLASYKKEVPVHCQCTARGGEEKNMLNVLKTCSACSKANLCKPTAAVFVLCDSMVHSWSWAITHSGSRALIEPFVQLAVQFIGLKVPSTMRNRIWSYERLNHLVFSDGEEERGGLGGRSSEIITSLTSRGCCLTPARLRVTAGLCVSVSRCTEGPKRWQSGHGADNLYDELHKAPLCLRITYDNLHSSVGF
ncbi:Hypothetical predicted protein [Pelobates cultripes]|uniref:Uncharacterized protein n=1 Tax=Pelobates cultripes TaxID=61616 RepID=A0AAD1SKY6_PELCU|nr:Hypothetical predicted protein [Pelobates cultripes]